MSNAFYPGQPVEISKAFSADTGYRTEEDEFSGCAAEVISVHGSDVLVYVQAKGEAYIPRARIKALRGAS